MAKELSTHELVINEIVEGAKAEFTSQRLIIQQVYEATMKELGSMKEKVREVEGKGTTERLPLQRNTCCQEHWTNKRIGKHGKAKLRTTAKQ